MSDSEKPPTELGSTYRRAELNVSAFRACSSYEEQVDWLLAHDAEVINRVRPQIEAEALFVIEQKKAQIANCEAALADAEKRASEARAAAIEDAKTALRALSRATTDDARPPYRSRPTTLVDAAEYISALATSPAGHVCVPVDLLDTLSSEEGAEQKDINEARRIVEVARPK